MKKLFLLSALFLLTSCDNSSTSLLCPVYPATPEKVNLTYDFYLYDDVSKDFTNFYKQYVIQLDYGTHLYWEQYLNPVLLLKYQVDFEFPEDISVESLYYDYQEIHNNENVDYSKVPVDGVSNCIYDDCNYKVVLGTKEQISSLGYVPKEHTLYEDIGK